MSDFQAHVSEARRLAIAGQTDRAKLLARFAGIAAIREAKGEGVPPQLDIPDVRESFVEGVGMARRAMLRKVVGWSPQPGITHAARAIGRER